MKPHPRLRLLCLAIVLFVTPLTWSQTSLYWDINGATAGSSAGDTAAGLWDAANPHWSTDVNGTAATQVWSAIGPAIFSAGTNATGTYIVTVDGVQTGTSHGLQVERGTVTFTGGTLADFGKVTVADGLTTTIASTFTTSLAFTKDGSGTLVLSGNNTFSNGLTLASGTLQSTSTGALGSGPVTFAGGTLAVTSGSPTLPTFSVGQGSATISNAGTVLTSSNYAEAGRDGGGAINVTDGGRLAIATSIAAGLNTGDTGTITVTGTGSRMEAGSFLALAYTSGTTGALSVTDNASVQIDTYALVGYQGAGMLNVTSGGTFTTTQDLNIANTATAQGTLNVTSGGTVTTTTNAYVSYGNAATANATVTGANSAWNISGFLEVGHDGTGTLNVTDGGSVTAAQSTALGVTSSATGNILVSGTGSALNTGTAFYLGHTGAGNLTIASGGAVAADNFNVGFAATGVGTLNLNSGGTLRIGGLTQGNGSGTLTLAGGTLEAINRSFSSSVPLVLASATNSTVSVSGLAVQLDGLISGAGGLTKTGVGILTLGGNNTFSGGTTLSGGSLHNAALGSGAVTLAGGLLDLGGFSPTLPSVVFNGGTFTNGSLENATAFEVQSGSLSAALTGNAALTKTTAGTFTLSGDNTYAGGTTINAGTLTLGHANALGTGATSIATDGTLDLGGYVPSAGNLTLDGGTLQGGSLSPTALTLNSGTVAATLTGTGALTKSGGSTITLGGNNTYSGGTALSGGSLVIAHNAALGTGTVAISNGAVIDASPLANLVFGGSGATQSVTVTGAGSQLYTANGLTFGNAGNSTVEVTGGASVTSLGTTSFGVGSGIGAGVVTGTGSVLEVSNTLNVGAFGGTGVLTIGAGGTVNAHKVQLDTAGGGSGTINLNADGTLRVMTSAGIVMDSIANASVNLAGGTLSLDGNNSSNVPLQLAAGTVSTITTTSGTTTYSGSISGEGSLLKNGSGALTLTGDNSFSGGLTVNRNIVSIGHANALGTGGATIGPNLVINSNVFPTTLDLGGFSISSGPFLIAGGNLINGSIPVASLAANSLGTVAATLTGAGTFTKSGAGTLLFSGANTYTGGTAVTAGTLAIGHISALGASEVEITADAILDLGGLNPANTLNLTGGTVQNGTVSPSALSGFHGTVTALLAGPAALEKTGASTLELTANNSYSGGTLLSGGTLRIAHAAALGTGDISINNGHLDGGSANLFFQRAGSAQTVTLNGTSSSLTTTGSVEIGREELGALNLTNGGTATSGTSFSIGVSGGSGIAQVTGTGSGLTAGTTIHLGASGGSGVLDIGSGGSVSAHRISFGSGGNGSGTLNLNPGGTLTLISSNDADTIVAEPGATALVNLAGGTLRLVGGTNAVPFQLATASQSTIETHIVLSTISGSISGTGALLKTGPQRFCFRATTRSAAA